MSVFNESNKGYQTNHYPLFLGDGLGLFDTVNVPYPQIEELYQLQMSQLWNEFEVDLTQDKMDMIACHPDVVWLMTETISWQWLVDTIAAKSISGLLIPHITNSEFEGMVQAQALFEVIHARTYSHIIKQTFVDPNEMLKRTYGNVQVLMRSKPVRDAFSELQNMNPKASMHEKRKIILKVLCALLALEGIAFMVSFAVTFGISETQVFQGIATLVGLICRDELLHARMDLEAIKILLDDADWRLAFDEIADEIEYIIKSVVEREHNFADYLFSNGRSLVGLNARVLKEYASYMSQPVFAVFGLKAPTAIKELPLPYMDRYTNPKQIQAAAQEIQLSNYNVGCVEDDTSELDLTEFLPR